MGQIMRFQEILRKLAIIDEGFVEDQARLGLDPAGPAALDAKTAALVRVGVLAAIGAPTVGFEWVPSTPTIIPDIASSVRVRAIVRSQPQVRRAKKRREALEAPIKVLARSRRTW
jgi:hypothetical protein